MKTKMLLLATLGLNLMVVGAYAQGTVTFANASTTGGLPAGNRNIVWAPGMQFYHPSIVPGANVSSNYAGLNLSGLRVQLFFGTGSDIFTFTPVAVAQNGVSTLKQSTSTTAGSWFSKTATLNGVTAGQTRDLIVVLWDVYLSADPLSLAARNSILWTQSTPFQYTMTSSGTPAPSEFLMLNFPGMVVGIPEPTSAVLLGMGFAVLMFRRRT